MARPKRKPPTVIAADAVYSFPGVYKELLMSMCLGETIVDPRRYLECDRLGQELQAEAHRAGEALFVERSRAADPVRVRGGLIASIVDSVATAPAEAAFFRADDVNTRLFSVFPDDTVEPVYDEDLAQ